MSNLRIIFWSYFVLLTNHKYIFIESELLDNKVDLDAEIAKSAALMRKWATSLSQELTILAKLARRDRVEKSFDNYLIYEENWDHIIEEVAKNIRVMMDEKTKAVQAIKQHAELLSLYRKKDITRDSPFDYYDANNLTQTEDVEDRYQDIKEDENIWRCAIPSQLNASTSDLCFENSYTYQSAHYGSTPYNAFNTPRTSSQSFSHLGWCDEIPFTKRPPGYYRKMNLKYHPQFDAEVNLNYSIVRVTPTVYKRVDDMLNEIRWSEALDLTFKCNFRRDPTLNYQYFGSPKGFMRFYPATKWSDEQYDDSIDFRIRSWYIESMASAKDMIILLDRSGSMLSNNRADIGKEIVNSILDTLTDNDYINIYTFTNTTEPLVDCFNDSLVQANEENLRLLRERLLDIKYNFYSDISIGLEKAFSILLQYQPPRGNDTGCNQANKAIMLITEGVDYEYRTELFRIYNQIPGQKYFRRIRVFTYLLGTEALDAENMQFIACANRGYYVNITVIEEVREKVQKYLEVLSRPINLTPEIKPEPAWTALYVHLADRRLSNWLWKKHEGNQQRDIYIQYEKEQIEKKGLMYINDTTHFTQKESHPYEQYLEFPDYQYLTSVSLPVFDRSEKGLTLLGVAGVDVQLDYIKQLAEPHRIGVNGYSFTVTNNGYILHHPDHRTEFAAHVLKPTFNRVDVTEVEISDDTHEARNFDSNIIDLRQNIVFQNKGKRPLKVRAPIDNMKRVMVGRRHYYYTKIGPFSMVIALPDGYGVFVSRMEVSSDKMKEIKSNLRKSLKKFNDWRVHPKWLYTCNTTRAEKNPEKELIHFLNTNATDCKKEDVVNALLKDVYVTEWWHHPNDSIFNEVRKTSKVYDGVILTFMTTHTGLTRWKDIRKLSGVKHFANTHNKATDEVFYRRGAEINYKRKHKDMFILSVPFENYNENKTLITASHVIFREMDRKRAPIAAVGYQILHKTLNKMLDTFTCEHPPCKISCAGPESWICYVIDNDGFIILARNTSYIGKSLVDVDNALMQALVKDRVFTNVTMFDYQATCFPNFKTDVKNFYGPTKEQAMNEDFRKSCNPKKSKPLACKTIEYLYRQMNKKIPTPCDQELMMYNYQFRNFSHLHSEQNHRDCPCPFITEPIKGTNLVLIALKDKCCAENSEIPTDKYPKDILYDLTLPCHIAVKNNFKKRHYTRCIPHHPDEDELNQNRTYCGILWQEGIVPLE